MTNFDDCVGECVLPLKDWFQKCFLKRAANDMSSDRTSDPQNKGEGDAEAGGEEAQPKTHIARFHCPPPDFERMYNTRYKRGGLLKRALTGGAFAGLAKVHGALDSLEKSLAPDSMHDPATGAKTKAERTINKDEQKFWMPMHKPGDGGEPGGWVQVSIELVDGIEAKHDPVGTGRSLPNKQPYLPPPLGRVKLTLNPFSLAYQLLGPKLCVRIACPMCCMCCCVLLVIFGPVLLQLALGLGSSAGIDMTFITNALNNTSG